MKTSTVSHSSNDKRTEERKDIESREGETLPQNNCGRLCRNPQAGREWNKHFKPGRKVNVYLDHYPAKLSFKLEGEVKTFQGKHRLKTFRTMEPAQQKVQKLSWQDAPLSRRAPPL